MKSYLTQAARDLPAEPLLLKACRFLGRAPHSTLGRLSWPLLAGIGRSV